MRSPFLVALTCVLFAGADVAKSNEKPDGNPTALYGLWRGSWGGGESDGVFYQPVRAELYIGKDQAVWHGLPMPNGAGAVSLSNSKPLRGRFTYLATPKDKPRQKSVNFSYVRSGEMLTLKIGENDKHLSLKRIAVKQAPFANLNVHFETARGIDTEGNLLVTTYDTIQVGDRGPELHAPFSSVRVLANANIYQVEENGAKEITVEEVGRLLGNPTPVVVASRGARKAKPRGWDLSNRLGKLHADSEAGLKTLTRLLRPGTLVFVLPDTKRILPP